MAAILSVSQCVNIGCLGLELIPLHTNIKQIRISGLTILYIDQPFSSDVGIKDKYYLYGVPIHCLSIHMLVPRKYVWISNHGFRWDCVGLPRQVYEHDQHFHSSASRQCGVWVHTPSSHRTIVYRETCSLCCWNFQHGPFLCQERNSVRNDTA